MNTQSLSTHPMNTHPMNAQALKKQSLDNQPLILAEDSMLQGNIEILVGDLEHLVHGSTNLDQCREELEALVKDLRYVLIEEE